MLNTLMSVGSDLRKMFSGAARFAGYLRTEDRIEAGISLFRAHAHTIAPGTPCSYEIALINHSDRTHLLDLLIDIYLKQNPVHPEGHYAYFSKRVLLDAGSTVSLEFLYDWNGSAYFQTNGVRIQPDTAWHGEVPHREDQIEGMFLVRARLSTSENRMIEELELVQDVRPDIVR